MNSGHKLVFLFLIGLTARQTAQAQSPRVQAELRQLYSGFPLDSSYTFIADYCRMNQFQSHASPVDPSRADFTKSVMENHYFPDSPDSINQSSYVSYAGMAGERQRKSLAGATIELRYLQHAKSRAMAQYKKLLETFQQGGIKTSEGIIRAENGETTGFMTTLWLNKANSYPLLSIGWKQELESPDKYSVEIMYVRLR